MFFRVIRPAIFTDIRPPWERRGSDEYQVAVVWSITPFAQQGAVWRLSFPVAGTFDDDLVAGVGQAVEGAVAEDGVVEEAEPFVHGPVAGDDEAGRPMAIEDQLVEIGGLLGSEPVQPGVVEDEQVGGEEGPEGAVQRVVDPAWAMAMKKSSAWLKRTVCPARTAE